MKLIITLEHIPSDKDPYDIFIRYYGDNGELPKVMEGKAKTFSEARTKISNIIKIYE